MRRSTSGCFGSQLCEPPLLRLPRILDTQPVPDVLERPEELEGLGGVNPTAFAAFVLENVCG